MNLIVKKDRNRSRQLVFQLPQSIGCKLIAGVDEAGRGPLAGDVIAAAVILDPRSPVIGLDDSKRLTATRREYCFELINRRALSCSVARASVAEIDKLNILQASLLAMNRAVVALKPVPEFVYVDGNRCPVWDYRSSAIVGGDARLQCVAAASAPGQGYH